MNGYAAEDGDSHREYESALKHALRLTLSLGSIAERNIGELTDAIGNAPDHPVGDQVGADMLVFQAMKLLGASRNFLDELLQFQLVRQRPDVGVVRTYDRHLRLRWPAKLGARAADFVVISQDELPEKGLTFEASPLVDARTGVVWRDVLDFELSRDPDGQFMLLKASTKADLQRPAPGTYLGLVHLLPTNRRIEISIEVMPSDEKVKQDQGAGDGLRPA